jgi:hypothetical protein
VRVERSPAARRRRREPWRASAEHVAALHAAVSDRTRVLFLMNPAIPSGWVATDEEWTSVTGICRERGISRLYYMVMEAIVFGGRPVVIPSGLEGMHDLTVTIGAVSFEQRMIGWRVGWMVANAELAPTLALVHIYNGVCTSGFGQIGAVAAIKLGDDDVRAAVAEWERRHDELVRQCDGLLLVPAHGGWSALIDAEACGLEAPELSCRLLEQRGSRDADDRLGRDGGTPARPLRVQQRARRAPCPARRAPARGTPLTTDANCCTRSPAPLRRRRDPLRPSDSVSSKSTTSRPLVACREARELRQRTTAGLTGRRGMRASTPRAALAHVPANRTRALSQRAESSSFLARCSRKASPGWKAYTDSRATTP